MTTPREQARDAAMQARCGPFDSTKMVAADAASGIWEPLLNERDHHIRLLADAIVKIAQAAGMGELPSLTGPQVLLVADDTAEEVGKMKPRTQWLVNFMHEQGWLEDGCFTFPDGETWEAESDTG